MWKPSFTTAELQFFTSIKTKVSILPNFTDDEMSLMTTKVGPFKANQPTHVPLWLALELKNCQRCKIYTPFWFDRNSLNEFIDKQRKYPNELTSLQNEQFFEISYIFISQAPDDIENLTEMRGLIEGLENMRREKVRRIFEESKGSIKLLNLTTYEVNRLRQPLSRLSMMVDRLKKVEKPK